MSNVELLARAAALRAEASALGAAIAGQAAGLDADELFEIAGALQGTINATEGAQLVATAHAASHETRLTERGPVDVHHDLGFVDPMTGSEICLATGLGHWVAARKVTLAARTAERFPRLLEKVVLGELTTATVQRVVSACDGLDVQACAAVEAVLAGRLAGLCPARVTTVTRRIATRVAGDQTAAAQRTNRSDRAVQVSPGPDGTSTWWAQLPADRSGAAWSAITSLAETYADKDPALTADQARADAFLDLLLTNVAVTATVTIGIPVLTGSEADAARDAAQAQLHEPGSTHDVGEGDVVPGERPVAVGGMGLGSDFSISTALSGCEIPGIGFVDSDTVEALLQVVPLDVGRALLDARTGTLLETVSTAYRPPRAITDFVETRDGTCRMWGCTRPARTCDTDHARPWPAGKTTPSNLGGLCRRHHRLKQRRRWTYHLTPEGTATWTSPTGKRRTTLPDHMIWPPPDPRPQPVPTANRQSRPPVEAPPF